MEKPLDNAFHRAIPPFRYDIVGSFLRPPAIKEARVRFEQGRISAEALTEIEDKEIAGLVIKQKEVGLKGVTDGEFRRSWWHLDFMWGLDGVEKAASTKGYRFHGAESRAETARLTGKVRFGDHPFLRHFKFLHETAGPGVVARQTIPAPAQFLSELYRPDNLESTRKIYASQEELLMDIAQAYRDAIRAFYALGCRNLQFDDCTWAMFVDKDYWRTRAGADIDGAETVATFARVNNMAIDGHPPDMVLTTHVCRGNFRSTFAASGGYEPIAETLFGKENVDAYYLEYDTDRAGDFSPLRFIRENKLVVLGLVSSKTGELEDKAVIISRIEDAARYVPLDRLCLSPQCGFASTEEGNILTEQQQWGKLGFIREIAGEVWK